MASGKLSDLATRKLKGVDLQAAVTKILTLVLAASEGADQGQAGCSSLLGVGKSPISDDGTSSTAGAPSVVPWPLKSG